jgi:hypothetical protein
MSKSLVRMYTSTGWFYKDDLLTWQDTGQQWQVCWTDEDYANFLAMDFGSQCGLLEQLEEVEA